MLVNWLFLLLALIVERLYRIRSLSPSPLPPCHYRDATQGHAMAVTPARWCRQQLRRVRPTWPL